MGRILSISRRVRIEIISADIPGELKRLNDGGIELNDVEFVDLITVQAQLSAEQYSLASKIVSRKGGKIRMLQNGGLRWYCFRLLKRPVLLLGLMALLVAAVYLPSRVFFVRVEGNHAVPTDWILEKASECGIGFGSSRVKIRSEQMKNRLLSAIPELQWAGINTSGCVAVISVKEKTLDHEADKGFAASAVVATRDGVIRSCTVSKGNGLCTAGQAVKAGQMLISGYQDCGLMIRYTGAEGEVYADTERKMTVVTPAQRIKRGERSSKRTEYSILIGKNLINLCNDSGICDTTCVKMYEEYYMSLPGGFRLPFAVVRQTWIYYDTVSVCDTEESAYEWVSDAAEAYLLDSMVAGQILNENARQELMDDKFIFYGHYACHEMIGKAIDGEYKLYDGKNS